MRIMLNRIKEAVFLIAFAEVLLAYADSAAAQGQQAAIQPARKWVVYLLPHSHVDIGYTDVQPAVERKQWQNLDKALELCRKTVEYPPGARFKWNIEVLWAVDSYLRKATPVKQQQLMDAIRSGQVELNALYGNELTGLCRPEEMLRLMGWGVSIGRRCGVKVESAMITDVPGCTWGIVPAMAQAGVKYFSLGPNLSARIGRTLSTWKHKPFYWVAPDGRQKVLCWFSHLLFTPECKWEQWLPGHLAELERNGYPYDIVQLPCFSDDNCPPDGSLCDAVKNWNVKHEYPKLVIATATEAFKAFEKRYADKIPVVTGEFTPYWEDGAGSSARETALNRTAAERLVQAETLSAMLNPHKNLAEPFQEAWRNVILYDEHTWGAHNSVTEPDVQPVKDQWKIKQAFALDADSQSRRLLSTVLAGRNGGQVVDAVDVFNTSSWPRTDLVILPTGMVGFGDVVTAPDGKTVPSQRLSTGELAFLAREVPALAGRRYAIGPGKARTEGGARAKSTALATPSVSLQLDPASGTIVGLRSTAIDAELSDMKLGVGLNHYYYVVQDRLKEAKQAGPATITVKESGPLVASLLVESDAPGCVRLSREIRVVDGLDRVDIVNVLDRNPVREKEGIHLGFAFNVPHAVMRVDIPWAIFRPEIDQMPGSCKEWLTVGRWVDVSNQEYGVTWATLDAPLIEVGSITAGRIGPSADPDAWLAKLPQSQTLYSWVMNNYWYTNYRAFQSGATEFRYSLLPHKRYDAVTAQRFGMERSQPLVIVRAQGDPPSDRPFLELDSPDVIVASIKPSEDRKALIVAAV